MLGASALYHRVTWSPRMRPWMRRIDHAGIYLLIAGTYTPVGLLVVHGRTQPIVLAIVWSGAAAAIILKFAWVGAPKWLSAVTGLAVGWAGVAAMPQVVAARRLGRVRAPRRRRARVHASARSSTRSGARTRRPPSSATTRSSTR